MSQRPFKILGIEHVGIAVKNLEGISYIFSDINGECLPCISVLLYNNSILSTKLFNVFL